jgi:hypothetical protein
MRGICVIVGMLGFFNLDTWLGWTLLGVAGFGIYLADHPIPTRWRR